MYTVYKVPVDAYDDPPACGVEIRRFNNIPAAIRDAERTMESERDAESAYFVVQSDTYTHIYSVGYIASQPTL